MSRIDGYNYYQNSFVNSQTEANGVVGSKDGKPDSRVAKWNPDQDSAVYDKAKAEKQVTYTKPVAVTKKTQETDPLANLSEAAKSLLKELQEKYGTDTDFVVSSFSTDEEANELMAQGTKQYTVLIDPELLEQMAADESVKEKYINEIDTAKGQLDSIVEELGDDIDKVEGFGISMDADGTISFFAKMREDSDKRSQQIQEDLKARREDAKAERKEKEKERLDKHLEKVQEDRTKTDASDKEDKSNIVTATSIEELIAKIRGYE